jgi:predicted AAA+ superfamily ATPase
MSSHTFSPEEIQSLAGETEPRGAHLENIVVADLLAWAAVEAPRPHVLHWRTVKGAEVDFVIWDGTALLPIEVTSGTARLAGARHLETFLDEYADRARRSAADDRPRCLLADAARAGGPLVGCRLTCPGP